MMLDPHAEVKIPADLAKRYALASALSRMVWNSAAGTEDLRIGGFFRISMEMPGDFAAMAMLDAMESGKNAGHDCMVLVTHPAYKEWIKKHGKALRGRTA